MKQISRILSPLAALALAACSASDESPMLKGHLAENGHNVSILLHQQEGSKRFELLPDREGNFMFSPALRGHRAEITISHKTDEFGAFIEEGKTSRLTIADKSIFFTGDNKEINEFCNSFHHLFAKENFRIDGDATPEATSEKALRLQKAVTELKQVLATVSDGEIREQMAERIEHTYYEYSLALNHLRLNNDISAYNNAVESVNLLFKHLGNDPEATDETMTAKLTY